MELQFTPANVLADVHASSKKQLFQHMADSLVSNPALEAAGVSARDIVNAVVERERLGSTGVGNGVALPHARMSGLDGIYAVFARLETPIDYEAVDDMPVDLVVMLVAPEDAGGAHLRALAKFSRRLRREDTRERLRAAPDMQSLFTSLTHTDDIAA